LLLAPVEPGFRGLTWLTAIGPAALKVLLLLVPAVARDALSLLDCTNVLMSLPAAATLDGGPPLQQTPSGTIPGNITLQVLSSSTLYVCWASRGRSACRHTRGFSAGCSGAGHASRDAGGCVAARAAMLQIQADSHWQWQRRFSGHQADRRVPAAARPLPHRLPPRGLVHPTRRSWPDTAAGSAGGNLTPPADARGHRGQGTGYLPRGPHTCRPRSAGAPLYPHSSPGRVPCGPPCFVSLQPAQSSMRGPLLWMRVLPSASVGALSGLCRPHCRTLRRCPAAARRAVYRGPRCKGCARSRRP